jgi:hypothetical protein
LHRSELIPVLTIANSSGHFDLRRRPATPFDDKPVGPRDRPFSRPAGRSKKQKPHGAPLDIPWRRALLLRAAIAFAAIAALLAAILIIMLFVGVILKLEIALVVIALFVGCLVAVIISLVYFIRDIELSLRALAMELRRPESECD